MKLLVCEECGARHYSASADLLVAQGARCDRCSARLAVGDADDRPEPVASAETAPGRLRRPG